MRLLKIFTLFSAFLISLAGQISNAHALSVDNIRYGVHDNKNRLVIELSEKHEFRSFMLSGPYRMVVDLPHFQWNIAGMPIDPNAGVTSIRKGELSAGISRIVFDLSGPNTIQAAFMLPDSKTGGQRLVIDFSRTNDAGFTKTRGKIFGKLTEGSTQTAPPQVSAAPTLRTNPQPRRSMTSSAPAQHKKQSKPLIIIDPGHGGQDPGAIGANGVHEKIVALAIGKELRKQLEKTGNYRVMMTRDTDVFIRLRDRVRYARKHEADLFISIHADSINKSGVRGASVYTLSEKASDRQTAALAARENLSDAIAGFDIEVEDDEVSNILVDLAMRDTMNQSKFVANTFVDEFRSEGVRMLDNPHRSAGFAVLKAADIPSILVETGFMSNRKEANLLLKESHRRKLAGALKKGIDSYFAKVALNQQ